VQWIFAAALKLDVTRQKSDGLAADIDALAVERAVQ
jgi:hypothetical protein